LVSGGVILVITGLTSFFWLVNFKSISSGVGAVDESSPLWQILVLWGGHGGIFLGGAGVMFLAKKKKWIENVSGWYLPLALGITALILILIPELLYVRDIYPTHKRANTMFKLTYQGFIMLSLFIGWLVGWLAGNKWRRVNWLRNGLVSLILVFFLGVMVFPVLAFKSYYGKFKNYQGIDGLEWMRRKSPDKWETIVYLEANRDGRNLLEAVGDSYSEFNAISAFSGTPSVLGWRVHEWLWRGGYEEVGKRDGEVREIYENPLSAKSLNLLREYDVGWVVVGKEERGKYRVDEENLKELGEIVWQGSNGYLIKIGERLME